jgi:hypothetical protein
MFVFTSERSKLLLDTTCTDGYTAQQPINLYLFSCTLCIVSMYLGPIAALNPLSQPQQARVATLHFVDSRALTADAVYSHRVSFGVPPLHMHFYQVTSASSEHLSPIKPESTGPRMLT